MSTQFGHTLNSRRGSDKVLWRAQARELISVAIALSDTAIIMAAAIATGVAYHQTVYGQSGDVVAFLQVGAITASIMVSASLARGEYRLANFLLFKTPTPGLHQPLDLEFLSPFFRA